MFDIFIDCCSVRHRTAQSRPIPLSSELKGLACGKQREECSRDREQQHRLLKQAHMWSIEGLERGQ
jgi:hypothetical protein